jgi:hypothetical protein
MLKLLVLPFLSRLKHRLRSHTFADLTINAIMNFEEVKDLVFQIKHFL